MSVAPGALGVSIFGTDPATKIFLPLPAYLISSLWLSSFRSSVGSSRGSTTGTTLPEAVRRVAGLAGAVAGLRRRGRRRWRRGPEFIGQHPHRHPAQHSQRDNLLPVFDSQFHSGTRPQITVDRDSQLDRSRAFARQFHAIDHKKHLRPFQRIDEAHQLQVVSGKTSLDSRPELCRSFPDPPACTSPAGSGPHSPPPACPVHWPARNPSRQSGPCRTR